MTANIQRNQRTITYAISVAISHTTSIPESIHIITRIAHVWFYRCTSVIIRVSSMFLLKIFISSFRTKMSLNARSIWSEIGWITSNVHSIVIISSISQAESLYTSAICALSQSVRTGKTICSKWNIPIIKTISCCWNICMMDFLVFKNKLASFRIYINVCSIKRCSGIDIKFVCKSIIFWNIFDRWENNKLSSWLFIIWNFRFFKIFPQIFWSSYVRNCTVKSLGFTNRWSNLEILRNRRIRWVDRLNNSILAI